MALIPNNHKRGLTSMDRRIAQQLAAIFPVFGALPDEFGSMVLESARHLAVPQGSVIFEDGSRCESFPLMIGGAVRVVKSGPHGRELLLYRVEPGETCTLSISCMLGKAPYSARGVAESELSLVTLPSSLFDSLISRHEAFRAFVFGSFSARCTELLKLVEEIAFLRLDQRLAFLLLAKGSEIDSTHQMLADELGSVREIVSRLLERFADQGAISLSRAHICVTDSDALSRIAHGK